MALLGIGETFGRVLAAPGRAPVSLSLHPAEALTPRHEHAGPYACVILAGAFEERDRRGSHQRRAGRAVIHAAGEAHEDRFGASEVRCLNLHVGEGEAGEPGERRLDAASVSAAEALAAAVARGDDPLSIDSLTAEIVGRLRRPADAADAGSWTTAVIEALSDDPDRDWSLSELARLARRHPTQTARGFRARTGLSIGAFRRRRRLTRLVIDLRLGDESLADLSARHGYADQAHMTREFRRFAGISPGAWRADVR